MDLAEEHTSIDWSNDFDHTDPYYAENAPEIWKQWRESGCPIARTERFGGTWFPSKHEQIHRIANDTEHFSSRGVIVNDESPGVPAPVGYAPPITSDPPFHAHARRLLLPAFSPKAINRLRPETESICNELIDAISSMVRDDPTQLVDAAVYYAQEIPVRVIAKMLGVPDGDGDRFRRFIHRFLERAGQSDEPIAEEDTLWFYLANVIADHRENPRNDLITFLLNAEIDGRPLEEGHVFGTIALLIVAGIDTTWSAIGASLWHLGTHPDDQQRLRDEPDLWLSGIEEFLRLYAPVTMARKVAKPIDFDGVHMEQDDWVLLGFPAANRDPAVFPNPETLVLDRKQNRHAAFGLGIHRCLGSNLARMELTVALQTWMDRIAEFHVSEDAAVTWATGQVRGPRQLPMLLTGVS